MHIMINEWRTIEKGYLGDLLVEKKFIENGFNLFKPVLENGKVDLIVEKNNVYLKLQIKTVQYDRGKGLIPVRKISHNMGVDTSTLWDWRNKEPNISNALKKGREVVDFEVENALLKNVKQSRIRWLIAS